jgi:Domain of unknown function (DUF6745)
MKHTKFGKLLINIQTNKEIFFIVGRTFNIIHLTPDSTLSLTQNGEFRYQVPNLGNKIKYIYVRNIGPWFYDVKYNYPTWKYEIVLNVVRPFFVLQKKNENITGKDIIDCQNAEIRRILIQRMGYEKLLEECEGEIIDESGTSQLIFIRTRRHEDISLVRIKDASTDRIYLLRVPPDVRSCLEAIAWTFGLRPDQYHPIVET